MASRLSLDLEGKSIWFKTEATVYEINVSPKLGEIVRKILSEMETTIIEQEVYKESLKLLVKLSSAELKCKETLTINAMPLNINNTANITIAGSGGIDISIFDSRNNMVYGAKMVVLGPIPSYPIFKPGQRMSSVFKWNTSGNVLGENAPPSLGEYYVEVEAYVTDLSAHSKLILKINGIEVKLLEQLSTGQAQCRLPKFSICSCSSI